MVWSREAAMSFYQIITYLKMECSCKEVKEFVDAINKTLETIANTHSDFELASQISIKRHCE